MGRGRVTAPVPTRQRWRERALAAELEVQRQARLVQVLQELTEIYTRALCAVVRDADGRVLTHLPDDPGRVYVAPVDRFGTFEILEVGPDGKPSC